jgi:predicted RNA-binding Zn ribbon-like protein
MGLQWTERQFVGGALALDFANTVCYRGDPVRTFDKLADAAEVARFAEAASLHSEAHGWSAATVPRSGDALALAFYRQLRDAIDALFRPVAETRAPGDAAYRVLLRAHHDLLDGQPLRLGHSGIEIDPDPRPSFALVLTQSALRLAGSPDVVRLKVCPNCSWLFVDRSKNASRLWCDMLTCGNRAKAERYYRRRRVTAVA